VIALVANNPRALQSNSAAVLRRFSDGDVPLNGQRITQRAKARPTIEELREYLDYEPETGVLRWRKRPAKHVRKGQVITSVNGHGYTQFGFRGMKFEAHRAVFAIHHGRWPYPCCDHVNGDKTDNRAANLRECTPSANMQNRCRSRKNTSGIKGLHWHAYSNMWRVRINKDGKAKERLFRDFGQAAAYVKQLREQLHGEFARH
jgi:hypothetical protein